MPGQETWNVRAGAFLTREGARVLDALSKERFHELKSDDLLTMTRSIGGNAPSKDRLVSMARNIQIMSKDSLDNEVRIMDAIRDAYGASVRRNPRRSAPTHRAKSDITEFTTAGSVFSRRV
tara:strand:- start:907 stop:1269 length:363 start_codon:yes stop_codon:yes gene_type:complete